MRIDSLRALSLAHLSMTVFSDLRFFTPTPAFWECLKKIVPADVELVDCGTGKGDLIAEAVENDFKIIGIDIAGREGQHRSVVRCNAISYPWHPKRWAMACRPSHDDWAYETFQNARSSGAHALYVGLPRNYKRDLGSIRSKCFGLVGQEGEKLWLINPLKSRS